jgi:hypothetical protein
LALQLLNPLVFAAGWNTISIVGAALFGAATIYWFALDRKVLGGAILRLKRNRPKPTRSVQQVAVYDRRLFSWCLALSWASKDVRLRVCSCGEQSS